MLPRYSNPRIYLKKKWVFKQSAAPTRATLAGAANGRPTAFGRGRRVGLLGLVLYFENRIPRTWRSLTSCANNMKEKGLYHPKEIPGGQFCSGKSSKLKLVKLCVANSPKMFAYLQISPIRYFYISLKATKI